VHRLALIGGLVAFLLSACGDDGEGAGEGAADAAPGGPEVDAGPSRTEPDAGTTVIEDPCEGQTPVCPAASGLTEGAGLAPIDRCAFPMEDRDTWSDSGALVDGLAAALDPVSLTDVLGDLNRTAAPIAAGDLPGDVPGVESAFGWQSGDESVGYWIPQGITGSGDGVAGGRVDGRRVLLVSWYYDREQDPGSTADKGVRLAVVDATDPASIHYRFVLLVEPVAGEAGPSFGPIRVHAGGLAWVGDYLYVVDTSHGFRVFDMTRILRVQTGVDSIGLDPASGDYYAHNYAYVVPQVGTYAQTSSCDPRFSFVSVDRTSDPPSTRSTAACTAGRSTRTGGCAGSATPAGWCPTGPGSPATPTSRGGWPRTAPSGSRRASRPARAASFTGPARGGRAPTWAGATPPRISPSTRATVCCGA